MTDTDIPPWVPPSRRCGVHFLADGEVLECLLRRAHRGEHGPGPHVTTGTGPPPLDHRLLVSISPGQRDTVLRGHCPECGPLSDTPPERSDL